MIQSFEHICSHFIRTLSHCSFLSNAEWSAWSKSIPVIIRATLFCRFCSLSLSASPQFPQTTLQYLIWGSISVLYIISRLSLGNTVLILLRIPMFLLSFPEMYSICCSHDRCSSIIKPRFLACFTRLIGALLIYRAYGVVSGDLSKFSSRFDVPMIIKSVLTAFRLSLFALSHSQIFMNEGINSLFNSLTFLGF